MTVGSTGSGIERLFETGAHFAQVKSRRHPSMKSYLIGSKGRQELIDLTKTTEQIEVAKGILAALAREGKTVLVVGGKVETADIVKKAAESIAMPYVSTRWLGGTISNWPEIRRRIERLLELTEKTASGTLAKQHTKLELVRLAREKERLLKRLDGITTLSRRPDALLVVDPKHERHAVKEANDAGVPIIAIMNSDCDITDVTYPIVANDASRQTIEFILSELVRSFAQGRAV